MSFNFDGTVLRGATSGGTNSRSTALATNGVVRDVKEHSTSSLSAQNPSAIDLSADQYRASVLNSPNKATFEYIIWASNTGKISTIVGDINDGNDPYLKFGNCDISFSSDGKTILIFNSDNNSIDSVFGIVIANTNTNTNYLLTTASNPSVTLSLYMDSFLVTNAFESTDLESGIIRVRQSVLDSYFDGAFDVDRDVAQVASYFLSPVKFYWSRNDIYQRRFAFDDRVQSWRLLKGSSTLNLGAVNLGRKYPLSPIPDNLIVGSYLKGDSANTDNYSMLRVGRLPNSGATPLAENPSGEFSGVLVVPDSEVKLEYDFSAHTPPPFAVIGESNSLLLFNPAFVAQKAGQNIWYSYQEFIEGSEGLVGLLENSDFTPLFIAPIPKTFERPFIKIGNRRHLSPIMVKNDSELGALSLSNDREFGISLSTGQLKFHSDLIGKAQKDSPLFDPSYLGAKVYYEGVSLNLKPQPLRSPIPLVDSGGNPTTITQGNNGKVYLGLADPYGNNGLGVSGILHQPDGSGVPFNLNVTTDGDNKIGIRQGGDTDTETASGLTREIIPRSLSMPELLSIGDTFIFTSQSCISIKEVDKKETENLRKMERFAFFIKGSVAEITREGIASLPNGFGSAVKVSNQSRSNLGSSEVVYFIQTLFTPSFYVDKAQITTKIRGTFNFEIGDILIFAVDTVPYKWVASALSYSADELITDIFSNAEEISSGSTNLSSTSLSIVNSFDYLVFECDQEIEIGFGLGGVENLSGCSNIGLNPGWRAKANQDNWLADSGVSFGLERSPLNKDGSSDTPDFFALYRLKDKIISPRDGIGATPVLFLDYSPLEDVAGYDENVFFRSISTQKINGQEVISFNFLKNYEQVVHNFAERYIFFIEDMVMDQSQTIENATTSLLLGATQMVPETFLGVEPNPTYGLYVSETGSLLQRAELGTEFLLDSTAGLGVLIEKYGELISFDFLGKWSQGSDTFINGFVDGADNFDTLSVSEGDKLKILSGDSAGYYIVQERIDEYHIRVSPPFKSSNGDYPVAWELYRGYSRDVYDPSLVADISYKPFSHLVEEPLKIRLLSWVIYISTSANCVLDLGNSLTNEHELSLRVTPSGSDISLHRLVVEKLGIIANQSIYMTITDRILAENFLISIDADDFTPVLVDDNGNNNWIPNADPNSVYINKGTGEVLFGNNLLTNYSSADVYYKETFKTSADLASGEAEFNAFTGECVFSEIDRSDNVGSPLYFVQQLKTTGEIDVACNPLGGSIYFLDPLKERRAVEVEYYLADDLGEKLIDEETGQTIFIKEFLPLYIRSEPAVFIENNKFSFNPAESDNFQRTLYSDITPRVVVDGFQCNYGVEDCIIEDNIIYFQIEDKEVTSSSVVTVSYAVLETQGGEQVFNTSNRPLYRPSFYIEQDKDNFVLDTDRTTDLKVGSLFRLGADHFYIKAVSYDSTTDQTTVSIFPPTVEEVGSRSPNNDVLTLVSSEPIAHTVDPDDPQTTIARTGFLLPLSDPTYGSQAIEWKPVNRGQNKIEFLTDLTKFAIAGHILEIGGVPMTISQSNLSSDGLKTIVELTSVFPQGFTMGSDDIKLSPRPIYPPFTQAFLGLGGFVPTEDFSLILFGELDEDGNEKPGRELVKDVHYGIDPNNGNIAFLQPLQTPLLPLQILYFNHTKVKELKPFYSPLTQTLIKPKYFVSSKVTATPSEENNLLGAMVQTRNTFLSPDTFYTRVVPLSTFSVETVQRLSGFATGNSQGPISTVTVDPQSSDKGVASLETLRSNITDDDRSAKLYLEFYNVAVNSFEQVSETITGNIIGDRDGKFRFFIGRGKDNAPKGYECPITGVLNPINIWALVFESESGFATVSGDDLLDPRTATLTSAEIDGENLNSETFEMLSIQQKKKIKNDIDDIVLTRRGRWKFKGWFELVRKGVFADLSVPSIHSRLFPEQAKTFFITYPGLQYDLTKRTTATNREDWSGHYAFSKVIEKATFSWEDGYQPSVRASTRNTEIGVISNPALGKIENIQDVFLGRRFPRARIFEYFPEGISANAFGSGFPSQDIGSPCVLATPLELSKFPIDPATGLPNLSVLIANGGDTFDLSTGDPDLRTPPFTDFELNRQVGFGFPTGETITPIFSEEESSGIFIQDVLYGCLITFLGGKDISSPTAISSPNQMVLVDENGDPSSEVSLERGDTIYLIPPVNSMDLESVSDPVGQEDLKKLSKLTNNYDTFVDRGRGILLDKSFWSHIANEDGWYTGPWFGQNPPMPLSELEGMVSFTYGKMSFFEFPALRGEDKDDDGDYAIPYLKTKATERDRFGEITRISSAILSKTSPSGEYVYADEIRDDNGFILSSLTGTQPPSALLTTKRHNPHSFLNSAIGKNDIEQFDLLLMEYLSNANLPMASQGILSVGKAYRNQLETLDGQGGGVVSDYSVIEPPRFISPTARGSAHRYTLANAMVHIHDNTEWDWSSGAPPNGGYNNLNTSGAIIHENLVSQKLVFDFSSLGQIELGDGTGTIADPTDPLTWGGKGGFNRLFDPGSALTQDNSVIINFFAREKTNSPAISKPVLAGDIILSIEITNNGTEINITYSDGTSVSSVAVETIFGIWSQDYQQSSSNNDFKTITITGMTIPLDLASHTEILNTFDGTSNTYVSDYAFDFSISVVTNSVNQTDKGSFTSQILSDRLTFSESYDLRYARPRGFRHPVGKQMLETALFLESVDTEDSFNNLQSIELTYGNLHFTFLGRDNDHLFPTPSNATLNYGLGTFTNATVSDQGDERGSLRVMGFEGTATLRTFTVQPTLSITVEDIDDDGDGIADRFGVITSVEVTDPGDVLGVTGEVSVAITGTGSGAIITATLDENGDLALGELSVLNGGVGYGSSPTITFSHKNQNVPIVADNITFALAPSNPENTNIGIIGQGSAKLLAEMEDTILTSTQFISGSHTFIEKGDIVVVPVGAKTASYSYGDGTSETFNHPTSVCGTYIVRQALNNNLFGSGHLTLDLGTTSHSVKKKATFPSSSSEWVELSFPNVDSINTNTNTVVLDRSVYYEDSPSKTFFGKKFIISHLVIGSGGSGFTKEDIGEQFSVTGGSTDCVVEIVGIDYALGTVTELAIKVRGSGFQQSSPYSWSVSPLGGTSPSPCTGSAFSVQKQTVFFVQDGQPPNYLDTIALSCPFTTITNYPDYSSITISLATLGQPTSLVFWGNVRLDNSFSFTLSMPDGSSKVVPQTDLLDFVWEQIGKSYVSGHKYLPINLRKNSNSDRYVGKRYVTTATGERYHLSSYGFLSITLRNRDESQSQDFVSYYVKGVGSFSNLVSERFGENEFSIVSKAKTPSTTFLSDEDSIIFDNTPTMLDIQSISDLATTTSLPFNSIHYNKANCFVRGDSISLECLDYEHPNMDYDNGSGNSLRFDLANKEGFIAVDGIYTEPSGPRPALNYLVGNQRVVEDTAPAVQDNDIGYKREPFDQDVVFQVKRIRRFHEIQTQLQGSIHPLRYAYEIRRGVPTGYSVDNKGVGVLSASNFVFQIDHPSFENATQTYTGTQLGRFNDEDVNVENGDTVRLLRNGELVETAEILRLGEKIGSEIVDKGFKLSLKAPGFVDPNFLDAVNSGVYTEWSFEVYLRNPIIPHEQSNEELLSLITEKVILKTKADLTNQLGGYVPHIPLLSQTPNGLGEINPDTGNPKTWTDYTNKLYDDLNAPNPNAYAQYGVMEGDIIIIDSAGRLEGATGSLTPTENGTRPFGDFGIEEREDGGANSVIGRNAYEVGSTSPLDDNRGFYRVLEVKEDHLVLQSGYANKFVGEYTRDISFPEDLVLRQTLGYTLYPTIHNSNLHNSNFFASADDREGQMDLRPTQYAGYRNDGTLHPDTDKHNSFAVSDFSIRPFSYRIIRPSTLFTEETIELVLMIRERMSSLIEHLKSFLILEKSGTYYEFQDNQHIEDIGTPTIAETGLGVYHNAYLEDILGRMDLSPFGNDSDCLSLLDRRFIIQDSQLDTLCPDDTGVGSGLVSSLGRAPYTAYEDTSGFYGGVDGSLVRPLLLDHIEVVLNDRDQFRDLRSTWIEYRTHRTEGLLAQLREFDRQIGKKIRDQKDYYLRLKSQQ